MTDYNLPWENVSVWTSRPGEVILMFPRKNLGPVTINLTIPHDQHAELLALMQEYKERFALPELPPCEPPPPSVDLPLNLDLEF